MGRGRLIFDVPGEGLPCLHGRKGRIIRFTESLCPVCVAQGRYEDMGVEAVVYEESGKAWLAKDCPDHGLTREIYWEDYEMYRRASEFADPGMDILNPRISSGNVKCPVHCGLCREHESHTALGNIVVTNRCNLACWYCFFYAREDGRIYEPSLEQIRGVLRNLKGEKPVGADAVQFTGGEPTLRKDLVDIIRIAKEEGFDHILINTDGVRISQDQGLARKIKKAGSVNDGNIILYLSFDGVSPETNPKNYWEVPGAIENCRRAGLQAVLVPTVIKGVNDHELGDIVRFALSNLDVVRGVNFQPVSLMGRMGRGERERRRITIPGVIKKLEEQLGGAVTRSAFYPIPSVCGITDFMEMVSGERKYRLSTPFACGMATYLLKDRGEVLPVTSFLDVAGLLKYLQRTAGEEKKHCRGPRGARCRVSVAKTLWGIRKYVHRRPDDLNIARMFMESIISGSYEAFLNFHVNTLFIGMMHFQDPYNYDLERVRKCSIHYATPDGGIIPFCAFNVLPDLYRDRVERRFSFSQHEGEAANGRRLRDDMYRRRFGTSDKKRIVEYYNSCLRGANI